MSYKVLARYPNGGSRSSEWGEWQVGTFKFKKDADSYIKKTVERYSENEPKYHLEMKLEKVSEEEAGLFNTMLNRLLD